MSKTVIVTGASHGIGAGIAKGFLDKGYNVVGTSRTVSKSTELPQSDRLVRVDGDIGSAATATKAVQAAIAKFGKVDALVNNAGIFIAKPFTDYTADDLAALISTNVHGFFHITQLVVKQLLAQKSGGSVVSITTSLIENPNASLTASVPMITKGGIDAISRSLASEYAKHNIRFNTVAPGMVDTPLHKNDPKDFLKTLAPLGTICDVKDIVDAVIYVTDASQVTGDVLHVDGGAHAGKW